MEQVAAPFILKALEYAPDLLITIFVAIVIPFAVRWIRANASKAQLQTMIAGADVAYLVVDNIARSTPTKIDDKAAQGIKVFRDQLHMQVSLRDEPKLKAIFTAKHEAEKRGALSLPVSSGSVPVASGTTLKVRP